MAVNTTESMLVSPCDPDRAAKLIQQITNETHKIHHSKERPSLLQAARSLVRALETPMESVGRAVWAEPTCFAAVETAINMGVFPFMVKKSPSTTTAEQLAVATGVEYALMCRILKHLAAMEVILEVGADEYLVTSFTRALAIKHVADSFPHISTTAAPACYSVSDFLASKGFKSPTDVADCPFQYAYKVSMPWYDWMNTQSPEVLSRFNSHMTVYHKGRPSWVDDDFYPIQDRLVKGMRDDPDSVFLVDVGGSKGQDLEELLQKHPNIPGKLILQDQPEVVKEARPLPESVEMMGHDFLKPQPIRGARSYYLHSILHNWPDAECHTILRQLAGAMEPGYSKVLINDTVIPATGANWVMTAHDIMMMVVLASSERRLDEFEAMISKAGLKITGIWSHPNGVQSLIECELA